MHHRLVHPEPSVTTKLELSASCSQSSSEISGTEAENKPHFTGAKSHSQSNNDLSGVLTISSQKFDLASILPANSPKDSMVSDDIVSPSLLNSAFNLTPPISDTSEVTSEVTFHRMFNFTCVLTKYCILKPENYYMANYLLNALFG